MRGARGKLDLELTRPFIPIEWPVFNDTYLNRLCSLHYPDGLSLYVQYLSFDPDVKGGCSGIGRVWLSLIGLHVISFHSESSPGTTISRLVRRHFQTQSRVSKPPQHDRVERTDSVKFADIIMVSERLTFDYMYLNV